MLVVRGRSVCSCPLVRYIIYVIQRHVEFPSCCVVSATKFLSASPSPPLPVVLSPVWQVPFLFPFLFGPMAGLRTYGGVIQSRSWLPILEAPRYFKHSTPIKVAGLDFLGGYLPSLSINYVAMRKDMEKRLPQLYYIKMKISYDLGFIAIGVAMAT